MGSKSGVHRLTWSSMLARPMPFGSTHTNGSRKTPNAPDSRTTALAIGANGRAETQDLTQSSNTELAIGIRCADPLSTPFTLGLYVSVNEKNKPVDDQRVMPLA